MADASIRRKPNGRYEVRWRTLDGRRRSRSFDSETDAKLFRTGIRTEQIRHIEGQTPQLTVKAFVETKWWPGVESRTAMSTQARWANEVRRHILPHIGSRYLDAVRVEDIDELYRERADAGAAHHSILKLRSVLTNIWTEASRLGYAETNPVSLSRVPTRARSRMDEKVFTLDEVRRIADEAAQIWPGYSAPILTAAAAGLRFGEIAALSPEDFDLNAGTIRVSKSLSEVGGVFQIKEPKTRAGNRVAVFHASIADDLQVQVSEWAKGSLMFPTPQGHYLRRSNFSRRVFRPAVERAELTTDRTFHSLRKTYATLLAEAGATPRSIADLLGHSQVSTTLDFYSSRFDGQSDRIAVLLGHRRLRALL